MPEMQTMTEQSAKADERYVNNLLEPVMVTDQKGRMIYVAPWRRRGEDQFKNGNMVLWVDGKFFEQYAKSGGKGPLVRFSASVAASAAPPVQKVSGMDQSLAAQVRNLFEENPIESHVTAAYQFVSSRMNGREIPCPDVIKDMEKILINIARAHAHIQGINPNSAQPKITTDAQGQKWMRAQVQIILPDKTVRAIRDAYSTQGTSALLGVGTIASCTSIDPNASPKLISVDLQEGCMFPASDWEVVERMGNPAPMKAPVDASPSEQGQNTGEGTDSAAGDDDPVPPVGSVRLGGKGPSKIGGGKR
jgi:hypothetical protein